MAEDNKAKLSVGPEIGVSGLRVYSGYVVEEFLKELQGERGRRVYREMSENDAIVGAVLSAIGLVLRAVKWRVQAPENVTVPDEDMEFVESLFTDMSHTWEDFLSEVLTMLVFGWSYHEIVVKNRIGPHELDPSRRSKHTDGRIGIRKLAPRSQDTLNRWEMQDDGGVSGMWQMPWTGNKGIVFIPIERSLLFRTMSRKNNPEGVSILRTAYRSWYRLKNLEDIEAIGVERELAGLPVVRIPAEYLAANASNEHKAVLEAYKKVARDIKFNEQGGLVIPSDPFFNTDGTPSSVRRVDVELLSSGGSRAININESVIRYQRNIARSVLADFIMLGTDGKGSYALSTNKTDLFYKAIEAILKQIAAPINLYLLPRIYDLNGKDRETMPNYVPGTIAPEDLEKLGSYVQALASGGAELFPDDELENTLRERADLPPKSEEAIRQQEERRGEMMPPAFEEEPYEEDDDGA